MRFYLWRPSLQSVTACLCGNCLPKALFGAGEVNKVALQIGVEAFDPEEIAEGQEGTFYFSVRLLTANRLGALPKGEYPDVLKTNAK